MKTWKKIEETRKRANEVKTLKRKNEDRVTKVGGVSLVETDLPANSRRTSDEDSAQYQETKEAKAGREDGCPASYLAR